MEQENAIYLGYDFKVKPLNPAVEILIAELGAAGFESFVETQNGLSAYIQKDNWRQTILNKIMILDSEEFEIDYTFKEIEQTNWNLEWEKNFNPIIVDSLCSVRAPFHEKPQTKYDIVIEPKMSFGTGHHETTHMMIQQILKMDLHQKSVLDMGCGTGVLAIFSAMKEAKYVEAIDVDNWCYVNSLENVARNKTPIVSVFQGDSLLLKGKSFDVIIANINRNVLLADIKMYRKALSSNGVLLLSGFYKKDLPIIKKECESWQLNFYSMIEMNDWVSAKFISNN